MAFTFWKEIITDLWANYCNKSDFEPSLIHIIIFDWILEWCQDGSHVSFSEYASYVDIAFSNRFLAASHSALIFVRAVLSQFRVWRYIFHQPSQICNCKLSLTFLNRSLAFLNRSLRFLIWPLAAFWRRGGREGGRKGGQNPVVLQKVLRP